MPEFVYLEIPDLTRSEIEAIVKRNDPTELLVAVLSVAMYGDDRDFAIRFYKRYAEYEPFNVRGNAILGFGHVARIDRNLD